MIKTLKTNFSSMFSIKNWANPKMSKRSFLQGDLINLNNNNKCVEGELLHNIMV